MMNKNALEYVWKTILFGGSGLILGDIINSTFTKICKQYPEKKFFFGCIQLACLGFVMNVIYHYISHDLAQEFQKTLPGLSFPAFYFATQKNILSIWYDTSISKFLN
jgi:hypothetical protein